MSLSMQRFEQLIGAYGSDPQRWPAGERQAALKLVEESAPAALLMQQSAWLDDTLDQFETPAFSQLSARILQQSLPERRVGILEQMVRWLVPPVSSSMTDWWRPAALACLPLAMGLFMGLQLELFADPTADFYGLDTEETELQFISLADYAEPLE
ncbi:MAG: hypothetical protein Q7W55_14020 [Pseudohongiella sp.]|nr:hypothetical protein [Pseudohongiella sp.]MDO9518665.1 hypothetical protein [Pseudohongiella sp.]MDP2128438.1 hypothetical protein [Pseudohongiella sp.]